MPEDAAKSMARSDFINRRTFLSIGAGAVAGVMIGDAVGAAPKPTPTRSAPMVRPAGATPSSVLRIGVPAYPGSWDQDFRGGFDAVAAALNKNVDAYMVDYGTTEIEGTLALDTSNIVASIAESWTADETGQVWTLTLRDGARFPSGNPITAADVKWSKDRSFAAQSNVAGIYRLIGLTDPEQIEVVDDLTVRFNQAFPSALSPQIQAICLFVWDSVLLQEHATDDDPWAAEWASLNPPQGGRFIVESAQPGQQIVLVANPDFPGVQPPLTSRIEMPVIDNAGSRRLQLEAGDIDIALGLGRQDIDDLRANPDIAIVEGPGNTLLKVDMLCTQAPFDNLLVRKAFAYAMPYDLIISNVYRGGARRANGPIPLDMPGNPGTAFPYDTDVDAAKAALAEAGVDSVEAELVYLAGNAEQEQIAVLIASTVAEAGFNLTPAPLDPATLSERRAAKRLPLQITSGQLWVDDVEYLLATSYTQDAALNYSAWVNPEIEEIFAQSHSVVDPDARAELWARVHEIFGEELPVIAICQPSNEIPMRANVSGWVGTPDSLFRLQFLEVE